MRLNEEAVAIDPEFVFGHLGVGTSYMMLHGRTGKPDDLSKAKAALGRALALDPENAYALGARAQIAGFLERRWQEAVDLLGTDFDWTALPDDTLGSYAVYPAALLNLGRRAETVRVLEQLAAYVARSPDRFPPDHSIRGTLANYYLMKRDCDQLLECPGARVSGGGLFQWALLVYDPYRDEPRFQALLERMNVVGIPFTGPA